ncbi:DUF6572 domain-containing protein [Lewinella sp. 4G2]|uniref:DUF6572 domain-containing protein n=1 Tax=Lewinella sp. 4G2 TaxID=1803372 RepID=UPI0007B4CAB6|nr:DUF6572 domain-containing protein [Lewinella sp. 4G2]OAV43915.1 hypothetical protein A3850_005145 [Lewinella sp. 4G2]
MAIDNPKVIDFISTSQDGKRVILTISNHLDWEDVESHLRSLQRKLYAYLVYVESGELGASGMKFQGLQVVVSVRCKYPVPSIGEDFYRVITPYFMEREVVLEYRDQ